MSNATVTRTQLIASGQIKPDFALIEKRAKAARALRRVEACIARRKLVNIGSKK